MFAANLQDTRKRIEIVTNALLPWEDLSPEPKSWSEEPRGPWIDFGDVLMRVLYVPTGMSPEVARRAVDQEAAIR
jgi:hypothetical protein